MFLQRLITSLILAPLVLLALFYGPGWFLSAVVIAILILCAWEWASLLPVESILSRLFYIALVLGTSVITYCFASVYISWALFWWVLIILAIIAYPASMRWWGKPWIVAMDGLIVLPLFALSLMSLYQRPQGQGVILYLLFLVWAADVGAYLLGKLCGKHKLIPRVSPGKSWEGLLGGVVLAMLIARIGQWYFAAPLVNWYIL